MNELRTLNCWLLTLVLLLSGAGAFAQGLGEELILSRLGDPVEVEIEVRDWQELDLQTVQVVNATEQQYAAFGLTYQQLLDTLSFNLIGPNFAGEVKILVSSREPVDEPFLELLLVLRWPDGSALREYILLFDPPSSVTESNVPEPVVSEPKLMDVVIATEPPSVPAPPVSEPPPAVPVTDTPDAQPAEPTSRRQYQVQAGDTLQSIARQFMPSLIADNDYQFMISLHDLNPQAFIDGNITLLRGDAVLLIPVTLDVTAVNALSARQLFDQRWLQGLRVQQQEEAPVAAAEPTQERSPPGTEAASNAEERTSLLEPAESVLVSPPAETTEPAVGVAESTEINVIEPVTTEVATIQIVPQQTVVEAPQLPASPSVPKQPGTDALQNITQQAEAIRDLLQTRQRRLVAVEQQIVSLRNQLMAVEDDAGALLQELNQPGDVTSQAILLGLVAAALLIALGFTLVTVVRWSRELQGIRRAND